MGRKRTKSKTYEDRPIDIDILFYNDLILHSKNLRIPHPLAHTRRFVLEPLADIAPDFLHPELQQSIAELLENVKNSRS